MAAAIHVAPIDIHPSPPFRISPADPRHQNFPDVVQAMRLDVALAGSDNS
jgi:hypothetical protein